MTTFILNLLTVLFKICPNCPGAINGQYYLAVNPNPAANPNNWDAWFAGTKEECEAIVRRSVLAAIEADKALALAKRLLLPLPEYMVGSSSFTFRGDAMPDYLIEDLEVINELADGSTEYDAIRDLWEITMESHIQCRWRDCGTCDGVACEESVMVEIPNVLLNFTRPQRMKAASRYSSRTQDRQFTMEDCGTPSWLP